MGATKSKNIQHLAITDQWTFQGSNVKSRIYKNQRNIIAEQLFVNLNSNQQLQKELEIYLHRKKLHPSIIGIYGVQIIENQNYFCSSSKRLRVLLQYFPKNIQNLKSLTFSVLAYILYQSLNGFKQIFQSFGRIRVSDNMIGISNQGVVKVWVNSNYVLNYPSGINSIHPAYKMKTKEDQLKMVRDIINLLKPYCKGENYPLALINYFNRAEVLDFDTALNLIERYMQDVQPQRPKLTKDKSIIDQLLFLSQATVQNKHSQNPENIIKQPSIPSINTHLPHTDLFILPSEPSLKKVTSDHSFFSNLSQVVNDKITNNNARPNVLQTNNRDYHRLLSPQLKRFVSIPNIRPYQGN